MRNCSYLLAGTLTCLLLSRGLAGEKLQSGPQAGEAITALFEPYNVTGEDAGKKHCLVCENGLNPVVMIFARATSDSLMRLLVKVDAVTVKQTGQNMGSFVVFLSDQDDLEKRLSETAQKNKLKKIVLSIDEPAGPDGYKVAKDAEVTVVLYTKHMVKANHAFRKGELSDQAIARILADIPKILPKN